ncbi:hypothetical protein SeLEV6574_g07367 [Synchytrium endobioticum]|nr:hypothetical protein SeLEV6574_g07367 [Synchytrium endobioticum]
MLTVEDHVKTHSVPFIDLEPEKAKTTWREMKQLVLLVSTLAIFTDLTIYSSIVPIAPFIIRGLGLGAFENGLLIVFFSIGVLVASPIFGVLSDRLQNRRWVLFAGLCCLIATTVIFTVARVYWLLAIARFFQGVAGGCAWTVALAMIADTYSEGQVGVAMSFVMVGFSLGQLMGPPIAGALFLTDYKAPFYFCYALIAIDLVGPIIMKDTIKKANKTLRKDVEKVELDIQLSESTLINGTASLMEPDHLPDGLIALNGLPTSETVASEPAEMKRVRRQIKYTTFDILKQWNLWILFIVTTFAASAWGGLEPILPFFLVDSYQFDSAKVGLYFLVPVIPSLIFSPVCGWLYDRYGMVVCIPGTFVTAIVVSCFGIPDSNTPPWVILILLLLYGAAGSFVMTPIMPELSRNVPKSVTARVYGIWNMFFSLGLLIGPLTASALYDRVGWRWSAVVQGGFYLMCIPGFFMYRRQPLPEFIEEEILGASAWTSVS